MEVKPGYKQTEVGVIPEDWDVKRLGDLGKIVRGGSPRPAGDARYFNGHFVPWLTVGSLTNIPTHQLFVTDTATKLTEEGSQLSRTLQDGTLVIVNSGARTLGVSKVLAITCCANDGIAALVSQSAGEKRFLCLFLNSQIRRLREVVAAGNDQLNLNTGRIALIAVPFPKETEQRAIAAALSDVDGLLGGLDRLIAKKRDLKQAAMQQLLTGQTRLPGFHGEWQLKRFGEVAFPRRDRVDPRRTGVQEFCVELEHIASASGELLGSTSTGAQSSLKSVFRPGDVLFGKLRAYLRKYWLATRSGVCSTEVWVFTPKDRLVTTEFLFQLIKTDEFIEAASNSYGTHMPRSDWNIVKNYELELPLLPEQTAIASVLTEMDAELAALEQRREKTRALKQAMMQELLTGRTRLIESGKLRVEGKE